VKMIVRTLLLQCAVSHYVPYLVSNVAATVAGAWLAILLCAAFCTAARAVARSVASARRTGAAVRITVVRLLRLRRRLRIFLPPQPCAISAVWLAHICCPQFLFSSHAPSRASAHLTPCLPITLISIHHMWLYATAYTGACCGRRTAGARMDVGIDASKLPPGYADYAIRR